MTATPLPNVLTPSTGGTVNPAELARKTQENFDALTLITSSSGTSSAPAGMAGLYSTTWTDYTAVAGYAPQYSKSGGIVVLEGLVTKPAAFPGGVEVILTLPAGFRPSTATYFTCPASGNGGTTGGNVILSADVAGQIGYLVALGGSGLASPITWISLGGITFKAAG